MDNAGDGERVGCFCGLRGRLPFWGLLDPDIVTSLTSFSGLIVDKLDSGLSDSKLGVLATVVLSEEKSLSPPPSSLLELRPITCHLSVTISCLALNSVIAPC